VLGSVGLGERGNDSFASYSLGMKQRLAIAATLLKDPNLLIFDEPTNGLDPAGIREVRETMRSLGKAGKTVLVSSHILAEVEQVADTVSIIGRGRLLASGTVEEIMGAKGAPRVRVVVSERERAVELLAAAGMPAHRDPEGIALLVDNAPDPSRVTWALAQGGLYLSELTPQHADLESVFLALTSATTLGDEDLRGLVARPGGTGPEVGNGLPAHDGEGGRA